jgi:hypothetical protein
MEIDEPQAKLQLAGRYRPEDARITLSEALLQTVSLAVRSDDLTVTLPGDSPLALQGTVAYRGYLEGLQRWLLGAQSPSPGRSPTADHSRRAAADAGGPSWRMSGELTGTAAFEQTGPQTTGRIEANITDLKIVGTSGAPFYDRRVTLTTEGSYHADDGRVDISRYELASDTINSRGRALFAASRRAAANPPGDVARIDFDGRMQYDMARLSTLLEPFIGTGVVLAGKADSPLTLTGPLTLAGLEGGTSLQWERGMVYGFPLGPATLTTRLNDGQLNVEPIALDVSGGRVRLAPSVRLSPSPAMLVHGKEKVVTDVQITPRMCAGALQYVAPVLAGATSAQGTFSIELDRCRMPLAHPERGDVAGRLIVHSVEIGPGAVVRELAALIATAQAGSNAPQRRSPLAALGGRATARLQRESVIPFRVADGRVHHENLGLVFSDVTIRTRGSVGFDRSLQLVASMPVPDKWLPRAGAGPVRDALARALENQNLDVAVGGTLDAPKLDRARLQRLNQQFLERASREMLREGINQGLEQGLKQLFGPPSDR